MAFFSWFNRNFIYRICLWTAFISQTLTFWVLRIQIRPPVHITCIELLLLFAMNINYCACVTNLGRIEFKLKSNLHYFWCSIITIIIISIIIISSPIVIIMLITDTQAMWTMLLYDFHRMIRAMVVAHAIPLIEHGITFVAKFASI